MGLFNMQTVLIKMYIDKLYKLKIYSPCAKSNMHKVAITTDNKYIITAAMLVLISDHFSAYQSIHLSSI